MTRGCYNCANRASEGKLIHDGRSFDEFYKCSAKSRQGVTVRVALEHRACRHWTPKIETK